MKDNGCTCRLCSYDREFAEHVARIPDAERPFFEELKERWEAADFDAQWFRCELNDERNADYERHAKAIEARRAATTGAVEDESAVPQGFAQTPTGDDA